MITESHSIDHCRSQVPLGAVAAAVADRFRPQIEREIESAKKQGLPPMSVPESDGRPGDAVAVAVEERIRWSSTSKNEAVRILYAQERTLEQLVTELCLPRPAGDRKGAKVTDDGATLLSELVWTVACEERLNVSAVADWRRREASVRECRDALRRRAEPIVKAEVIKSLRRASGGASVTDDIIDARIDEVFWWFERQYLSFTSRARFFCASKLSTCIAQIARYIRLEDDRTDSNFPEAPSVSDKLGLVEWERILRCAQQARLSGHNTFYETLSEGQLFVFSRLVACTPQVDIAAELGVSEPSVSRLKKRAIERVEAWYKERLQSDPDCGA